jgi:WD40 repeat protein
MAWLRQALNWRRSLLIAAVALTASPAAAENQPSTEPVLRVETGTHTASINGAATDAVGRVLATASDDKTVRLWSLDTGELLRVLRPPIGEGDEGKLYAVAMSPDGRFVVTAGWTGQTRGEMSLYVFEAASGRVVHLIGGLPNVILHLAWSPDGNFVVATLGRANGIRVYRVSDWQEVARDTDFMDESNGAAFDRSGRLAVVASDGFIRLYDREFRRLRKVKARGGADAFSVAFSPDGSKLLSASAIR